jgi:hypothetical protein
MHSALQQKARCRQAGLQGSLYLSIACDATFLLPLPVGAGGDRREVVLAATGVQTRD